MSGYSQVGWILQLWFRQLTGVFYPQECVVCGRLDQLLCPECLRDLESPLEAPLKALGFELLLPPAEAGNRPPLPLFYASPYTAVAAAVTVAYKEHGLTQLSRPLSRLLSAALESSGSLFSGLPLITVPSGAQAFRERGFHPVDLLLRQLDIRPRKFLSNARATADQARLQASARASNRRGSLRVYPELRLQGSYVLVEDLVTSGATAWEVARAVEQAGGNLAGAVALFRPHLPA